MITDISKIKVGFTYDYFDDGKVKETRRMDVVIKEIIPFNKIDPETLEIWKDSVEICHWLYAEQTDVFIKGELDMGEYGSEIIYFVRTKDNRFFSIGEWAGVLYDKKTTDKLYAEWYREYLDKVNEELKNITIKI